MNQEHWDQGHGLILIAGGVGINPILSILNDVTAWIDHHHHHHHHHHQHEQQGTEEEEGGEDGKVGGGGGGFKVKMIFTAADAQVR